MHYVKWDLKMRRSTSASCRAVVGCNVKLASSLIFEFSQKHPDVVGQFHSMKGHVAQNLFTSMVVS